MTKEEQYLELIDRVAKLDVQAALYMQNEARELKRFRPDTYLDACFCWDSTPQGHSYWQDIHYRLENNDDK